MNQRKSRKDDDGSSIVSDIEMLLVSPADIEEELKSYSSGYTDSNVKTHVSRFPHAIDNVKIVVDIFGKDKEDEIGALIYDGVQKMIKVCGKIFRKVVENNFDIEDAIGRCISRRSDLEVVLDELTDISEEFLVEPQDSLYTRKALREIETQTEIIRGKYERRSSAKKKSGSDTDEKEISDSDVEIQIELMSKSVKKNFECRFLDDHTSYLDRNEKKNEARSKRRISIALQDKEVVYEQVLKSYFDAMIKMVGRIDEATLKFPFIRQHLTGTVVMSTTGELISNPLNSMSLPGIVQILFDKYHKNNIISIAMALMACMFWKLTKQETEENPQKGVIEVEKIFADWEQRSFWEQLTKDIFFTVVLIQGLHPSVKIRLDLLDNTQKFIQDAVNSNSATTEDQMPIFRNAVKFINNVQANSRFSLQQQTITNNFSNGNVIRGGHSGGGSGDGEKKKENGGGRRDNTESAAAANDTTPVSENSKRFSGEVLKSRNITVSGPYNQKYPYIAVLKPSLICDKCFPESGIGVPCGGRCFGRQCNKCKYFGHSNKHCSQATKVNGDPVA